MGGVLVKISGEDRHGRMRTSKQIAYVAEEVDKVFLSKKACEDLGIIGETFPAIGDYPLDAAELNKELGNFSIEINDSKQCTGLSDSNCSCPKCELPPIAPTECPFPPTLENVTRLESWIREKYKASTFNNCNSQALPLMKDSPPLRLFIDKEAQPIACHKPAQIPIHFKDTVEKELRRDVKLGVIEEVCCKANLHRQESF